MDFKFFIGRDIIKIFATSFHTSNMVSYLGYITNPIIQVLCSLGRKLSLRKLSIGSNKVGQRCRKLKANRNQQSKRIPDSFFLHTSNPVNPTFQMYFVFFPCFPYPPWIPPEYITLTSNYSSSLLHILPSFFHSCLYYIIHKKARVNSHIFRSHQTPDKMT